MDKLIVIEGKDKYTFSSIEDLVKVFIDENFYELNNDQKLQLLEMKSVVNIGLDKIEIVKDTYKDNSFILLDEYTYILSLALFGKILLLERVDAKVFCKYINDIDTEDNYIIVNRLADKIMKNYLEGRK